jgi:F-type H+-transporting ATPase subunit epsilon
MTMQVQVVSPERILWSGDAELVTCRTIDGGDITFLTGHSPFVGALESGRATIRPQDGADTHFAVHGGFVEVSHDSVSLLTDVSEHADDIDVERARTAQARATEMLAKDPEDAVAMAALRRAEVRLELAGALAD